MPTKFYYLVCFVAPITQLHQESFELLTQNAQPSISNISVIKIGIMMIVSFFFLTLKISVKCSNM